MPHCTPLFAIRTLLCIAVLLGLSACQPARHLPPASGAQQTPHLIEINQWRAEGKLALSYSGERDTASFDWRQRKQNYAIHLFGPLGQGSTWLKKQAGAVTLEAPKITRQTAQSAEELMLANLGWQVPISNMQYWIRGLAAPAPSPTAIQYDATSHLAQLQQEGWQVEYHRYEVFDGWHLPTKLTARRDDISLRLIIKRWSLPKAQFRRGQL